MKIKIVIVILALAAVGLGIAFFATKQQAEKQHEADTSSMLDFSNQVVTASQQVKDLQQENLTLTNTLVASTEQAGQLASSLSNQLASTTVTLEDTRTRLAATQSQLDTTSNQVTVLNVHLTELELQNKALDQRAGELTNAIAQLNAIIAETREKLAVSETNGAFLQGELQKQMAQKAELEKQFNDLDVLRAQIKKIRTEAFVTRRVQLMKNDNGNKKGAELLLQRNVTVTPASAAKPAASYDLNVEVGSDGSVRVIPPLGTPTNSPAH
jgi:chromosome segregation ATPase